MRVKSLIPPVWRKHRLPAPYNLIRLIVALSPPVLLIFWAVAYLRSTWYIALAPGVPIEMTWPTKQGDIRVRAESYLIDLHSGITRLRRVSITMPDGRPLAQAESITVVGINPLKISDSSARVKIDRASLNLVREANGQLEVQDLLPKGPSQPAPFPFSVNVANLAIHYEDRTSESRSGPWKQDGVLTNLNVAGVGRDMVGGTQIQAPQIGGALVSFRSGDKGLLAVQVKSDGVELGQLADRVLTKAQRNKVEAYWPAKLGRLRLAGPATVVMGNGQPIRFSAQMNGQVDNASWKSTIPPLRRAVFQGVASEAGLRGSVTFDTPGAKGKAIGSLAWTHGLVVQASTQASVADLNSLPSEIRHYLPKNVGATGISAVGGAVFQNGQLTIGNRVLADHLVADKDRVNNASADVLITLPDVGLKTAKSPTIAVGLDAAHFGDTPLHGRIDLKPGAEKGPFAISGAIEANTSEGMQLLHRFTGWNPKTLGVIDGHVRVVAILSGDTRTPTGLFQASATGGLKLPKQKRLAIDSLFARGDFSGLVLNFNRVTAKTDGGVVLGVGTLNVDKHSLDFTLDGRGLDLRQFSPEVIGQASVAGHIQGPWIGPSFNGEAEAYDAQVRGEEVALVRTDISANPEKILADNLQAVTGSAVAEGWLSLTLKDQGLGGEISAPELQLADFLGPDFDGVVNLKTQKIAGTLKDPDVTARALASNMVLGNVPATLGIADVHLKGSMITLSGAGLSLLGGSVQASGDYDLNRGAGTVEVAAKDIGLDPTYAAIGRNVSTRVAGRVAGSAVVHIKKTSIQTDAKGQFAAVELNGSTLGSGVWSLAASAPIEDAAAVVHVPSPLEPDPELLPYASTAGTDYLKRLTKNLVVTGSAQIGHQTTFLSLENASYHAADKTIAGELLASDVSIKEAFGAALPYLTDLSDEVRERLSSAEGNVVLNLEASGTVDHPDLKLSKFEADALQLNGIPLGRVEATANLSGKSWTLSQFNYSDGAAEASFKGDYVENGDVKGDAEISNLDLDKLTRAWPSIPHVAGLASASFVVTGKGSSPEVRGTVNAVGIQAATGSDVFGLDLNDIRVRDGLASIEGNINGVGFVGNLTASAPIRYPLDHLPTTPLTASITLLPRDLKDVEGLPTAIDPARLDASLTGKVDLTGTLGQPEASGNLKVEAKRLGFRIPSGPKATDWLALKTELLDTTATVKLDHEQVNFTLQSKSSAGGSVTGSGSAQIPPISQLLANGNAAESTNAGQKILDAIVQSKLTFTGFKFDENNKIIAVRGTTGGDLQLNGPLSAPTLSGDLTLDQASSNLPNLVAGEGSSGSPTVNPKFNLTVKLGSPAKINNSLASFNVTGTMRLNGSLSQPDARAGLTLVSGNLQLPGGKVILNPGGRIVGTYNVEADGVARAHVNVDIVGESHVVAVRAIDEVDPYDVTLNIRGDMLDPDHVNFDTTSIPPGLDKNDILGLLGRTDILTAFGASDPAYGNGRDRLQNAITSYALPTLVSPLTNGLANGLSLDYLSLQFNALNQTIVFAGKTLSNGFSIYIQRQVSPATPGFPALYDYRLNYRPPFSRIVPRQVSFFVGTDQQRPWKIGIDYSFRF